MSTPDLSSGSVEIIVAPIHQGERLDWFLARQFPTYSRVTLRRAVNAAAVKVDGKRAKAAHRLKSGERITIQLPEVPREGPQPENIPLTVLFEDDVLAVIDKP